MAWEIRAGTVQEIPALIKADSAAFGNQPSDAEIEAAAALLEVDRTLVAVDGERVVGSAAAAGASGPSRAHPRQRRGAAVNPLFDRRGGGCVSAAGWLHTTPRTPGRRPGFSRAWMTRNG